VNQETEIRVISEDSSSVQVIGSCKLLPEQGSNYALGEIRIRGRRLIKGYVKISAILNGDTAIADVKVIQKEEPSVNIEIELRDEDFGNFRSQWAEYEGKPNLLLISARHKSIRRYLHYDPDLKEFTGDTTSHFRLLLAEIVTESVCRKSLVLEATQNAWVFGFADLKDDNIIVDSVIAELQKRIRSFAFIAHQIMLEV
jgi:hypothetical protein